MNLIIRCPKCNRIVGRFQKSTDYVDDKMTFSFCDCNPGEFLITIRRG